MKGENLANSERNMEVEKELQEKTATYRVLESRLNSLANQQKMFASKTVEVQSTIGSISELQKGKEAKDVLFPLGSAAYTKGAVADKDKLIVEVGAGVALEKTADEAKAILEERRKELEGAVEALQREMQNIASMMQKIEADVQKMVVDAQKEAEKFKVVSSG